MPGTPLANPASRQAARGPNKNACCELARKLSRMNLPHHSGLDADPNLNLVSEHLKSAFCSENRPARWRVGAVEKVSQERLPKRQLCFIGPPSGGPRARSRRSL